MEKRFEYYQFHPMSHHCYPTLVSAGSGDYEYVRNYFQNSRQSVLGATSQQS
jgi:hypothetical protein